MNPFLDVDAARYDAGRPYFHPLAVQRVAELAKIQELNRSLDVACGTGKSAEALIAVSRLVVGLDTSGEMLGHARRRDSIPYVQGVAEGLPFRDESFDFVSVALGLHWFDRRAFLREAHRVLLDQSWLLIYDSGFCERMRENEAFSDWVVGYRQRYPSPPRNIEPLAQELLDEMGFRLVGSEPLVHTQDYDLDDLTGYLETQSRIVVALREDRDTTLGVSTWLQTTLTPIIGTRRGSFEFDGSLLLLQRSAN